MPCMPEYAIYIYMSVCVSSIYLIPEIDTDLIPSFLMFISVSTHGTREQNALDCPALTYPEFPIFRNFISISATETLKGFFDSSFQHALNDNSSLFAWDSSNLYLSFHLHY